MERPASNSLEDVRQKAEFDRQMGLARVNRMRGDYAQAAESVRLALKVKPNDPEALEFAADILSARGELEKALEIYKSLFEADPKRTSAEQKFARLTLQISEGNRQQNLLQDMAENPEKYRRAADSLPNPTLAAILSFIPGLGHIYCRQIQKGIILFAAVTVSFLIAHSGVNWDLLKMPGGLKTYLVNMDPMVVALTCLALAVQLYALIDAPRYAAKLKELATKNGSEPEF